MNPDNVAADRMLKPQEETEKTGVTSGTLGNPPKGTDVIPSESSDNPGATPKSGASPIQKQQGADKPHDTPKGEQEDAIKSSKDEAEDFMKTKDPNDHSGEPMKMHDGSENKVPSTLEERRDSKAGMPGGQPHGQESKGTGEQWVKTSGMHADGGDFDATKPGAGREAERAWHKMVRLLSRADGAAGLMEGKGIKKEQPSQPGQSASPTRSTGSGDKKEKVPLSEKIKTKLHISHHKDKWLLPTQTRKI